MNTGTPSSASIHLNVKTSDCPEKQNLNEIKQEQNLNVQKKTVNRFYLSGKPEAKDGGCVEKGGVGGGGCREKGGGGDVGAVKGELKLLAGAKVVCLFLVEKKETWRVRIDEFCCIPPTFFFQGNGYVEFQDETGQTFPLLSRLFQIFSLFFFSFFFRKSQLRNVRACSVCVCVCVCVCVYTHTFAV